MNAEKRSLVRKHQASSGSQAAKINAIRNRGMMAIATLLLFDSAISIVNGTPPSMLVVLSARESQSSPCTTKPSIML